MARLPVPWPLGRRGSWLQSSCLLTTHLRSPEGVGQKTHAQSHLKQQSPNVHGAEGSVFQHTPPPPSYTHSIKRGPSRTRPREPTGACCWAHRLFPQHLKDSCPGSRQGYVDKRDGWAVCACLCLLSWRPSSSGQEALGECPPGLDASRTAGVSLPSPRGSILTLSRDARKVSISSKGQPGRMPGHRVHIPQVSAGRGAGWTPSPQSCSQVKSAVRIQSPDSQKVDSRSFLWSTEYRPSTGAWI